MSQVTDERLTALWNEAWLLDSTNILPLEKYRMSPSRFNYAVQTAVAEALRSAPSALDEGMRLTNEFTKGAVSVLKPQGTEETGNDRPAAPICKRCDGTEWIEPSWPVGPGGNSLGGYECPVCKLGTLSTQEPAAGESDANELDSLLAYFEAQPGSIGSEHWQGVVRRAIAALSPVNTAPLLAAQKDGQMERLCCRHCNESLGKWDRSKYHKLTCEFCGTQTVFNQLAGKGDL